MKSSGEIKQKMKQVRFRHLKKEMDAALSARPENCTHSIRLQFAGIHLCGQAQDLSPCSDTIARSCGDFACKYLKDEIRAGFDRFLLSSSVAEVAYCYPDLAALMWVCDDLPEDWFENVDHTDVVREPERRTLLAWMRSLFK